MNKTTPKQITQLENSALWQLSKQLALKVRETVKTVPYQDYYTFSSNVVQSAVSLTSDIALIEGKSSDATLFDYHYARGHLFTAKGLLLMAEELKLIEDTADVMRDIAKLEQLIEQKIAELKKVE